MKYWLYTYEMPKPYKKNRKYKGIPIQALEAKNLKGHIEVEWNPNPTLPHMYSTLETTPV